MDTKIRNSILEEAKNSKKPVKVFITNGFQMTGVVMEFDDVTVLLGDADGKRNLVFQASISTISI